MSDMTSMKISKDTWQRLNRRKQPGDSFDDVVQRLLDDVEASDDDNGGSMPEPAVAD
jgi:predicted CopG family antitoxin